MSPAKTQISLGIRPVWSEFSLYAQWVAKDPRFLHADSEDSNQTGRMPRLIWVFAGRTCHFLVLSCGGSNLEAWHMLIFTVHSKWPPFYYLKYRSHKRFCSDSVIVYSIEPCHSDAVYFVLVEYRYVDTFMKWEKVKQMVCPLCLLNVFWCPILPVNVQASQLK